jgi:pyruvate/2-oxoglutarate/acetoin dehydrogenase E1 component
MAEAVRELTIRRGHPGSAGIAMEADERVFLMGEDIGVYGGAFQVTGDLVQRFRRRPRDGHADQRTRRRGRRGRRGDDRGAAGLRDPVLRLSPRWPWSRSSTRRPRSASCWAARRSVPLVMRFPGGSGTGAAAQHSQSLEAWFAHVPGLKVVQPSTPHDAKGMLLAAIEDPDPVMIFEHKLLYKMKGPCPKAIIRADRQGARCAAKARTSPSSLLDHGAQGAGGRAELLAAQGIGRGRRFALDPADGQGYTIAESVRKTTRLMCVYEGVKTMGIGAEVSAMIAESEAFDYLDAPIIRLGGAETPLPYNPELEKAAVPQVPDIVAAARDLVKGVTLPRSCRSRSHPAQGRHGHGNRPDFALVCTMPVGQGDFAASGDSHWANAPQAVLFEIETDKAARHGSQNLAGTQRAAGHASTRRPEPALVFTPRGRAAGAAARLRHLARILACCWPTSCATSRCWA